MKYCVWMWLMAATVLAQESPIMKAVDSVWGFAAGETIVTAPLWTELIVTPEGKIVEVRTEADIAAPMVQALQQYEMRPNPSPYSVSLALEWKAPLRDYVGPPSGWRAEVTPIADAAAGLDAAKAAEWEGQLVDDPGTVTTRSVLVMWASRQSDAESRAMRARQVEWLVEHAPDAEILRHASAWIDRASNPQGYIRIRQLWLNHFRTKPANAKSIGAAVMFLRRQDPQVAESLLTGGAKISFYATPELGALYAAQALAGGEFGTKARAALTSSSDVRLLRGAWRALTDKKLHSAAGFDALCALVTGRLKAAQPGAPGNCVEREYVTTVPPASTVAAAVPGGGRIRVSSTVQAAALIKRVAPVYPPIARAAGVQGKVIFTAIIGKDGKIRTLNFVSGHPMLRPSAEEAVAQWQYRPTVLNGEAVEVATDIEVNFTLN